ncbi:SNF2 family amino-terminal protein, partial [Rhizoctonia solani AG-3 Rhs1AP]
MPEQALARSLLHLFDLMTEDEQSAFECPPWTSSVWRECFGLVLLKTLDVTEDDLAALKSLSGSRLKVVSDGHTIIMAERFMCKFWQLWCGAAAQRKPIDYAIGLVTPDTPAALKKDDSGYREYRELVLAAFDRAGGINAIVDEVMNAFRATPAEKWKDQRNTNRGKPPRKRVPEHAVVIPTASQAIDTWVHAALAHRLFGDTAVDVGGAVVREWQKTINCFLFRRYENLLRRLETRRSKSAAAMVKLDECLKAASERQTPETFRAATQALVAWRKVAIETLETDDPPFLERDKQLAELWADAGFEFKDKVKRKSRTTKVKNTSSIPTEAEMEAAFLYYVEDYCNGIEAIDELPAPGMQQFPGYEDLLDDGEDIGVQEFKDWPVERVWQSLGLAGTRQFPFAEPGTSYAPELKLADKAAVFPLSHQVIGAHVMVAAAFTEKIGQRSLPSLLCDDVGLGKTIQIIGLLSIVKHYYEQQHLDEIKKLAAPEFITVKGTPYFAGRQAIPNLPSLVISPCTLSGQWMEQIAKFTQQGSFAVVRYAVDQGPLETFSSNPKGGYRIAAGPGGERASSIIIVADLSAITKEAKRCLEPPAASLKGNAAKLWEARGEVSEFREGLSPVGSLLSMHFRVAAVDEVHQVRNCNVTQRGVQVITENSDVVVGASATPLVTSVPDLGSLARNVRYEPMLGDRGVEYHKQMAKSKREREKEWATKSTSIILHTAYDEAQQAAKKAGIAPNPRDLQFNELFHQAERRYDSPSESNALKTAYVSQPAIRTFRSLLRPIAIRRTALSKGCDGNPILALPPLRKIVAWTRMTKPEAAQMAEVNEMHLRWKQVLAKQLAEKGESSPDFLRWRNFLLDQKHCSMHADILRVRELERERGLKEGDLLHSIICDWDASNIDEKASSRMLTVDGIVNHYHNREAILDDPLPSEEPRKFLLYVSLSYHRNLFGKMFELKKRGFVYYDGSMTPAKRQKAVDKFNTDGNCRIMIISNVGSAGLNLTVASVVILASPVWSGQETLQIFGRCYRYGQRRDVAVYTIVSRDGIDLALLGYAGGKTLTSEQFMMSQNEFQQIYQGITAPAESENEEEQDEGSGIVSTKGTKVTNRKRKQPLIIGSGEDSVHRADTTGAMEPVTSRPEKRSKLAASSSTGKVKKPSQANVVMPAPAQPLGVAANLTTTSGTQNVMTPAGFQQPEGATVPATQKPAMTPPPSSTTSNKPAGVVVNAPGTVAGKSSLLTHGVDVPERAPDQTRPKTTKQTRPRPRARPAAVLVLGSGESVNPGASIAVGACDLPVKSAVGMDASLQSSEVDSFKSHPEVLPQANRSQVKFRPPKGFQSSKKIGSQEQQSAGAKEQEQGPPGNQVPTSMVKDSKPPLANKPKNNSAHSTAQRQGPSIPTVEPPNPLPPPEEITGPGLGTPAESNQTTVGSSVKHHLISTRPPFRKQTALSGNKSSHLSHGKAGESASVMVQNDFSLPSVVSQPPVTAGTPRPKPKGQPTVPVQSGSKSGAGRKAQSKFDSLSSIYRAKRKQLTATGGGVGNESLSGDEGGEDALRHVELDYYIPPEGPNQSTPNRVLSIWDKITSEFKWFPQMHKLFSARPNQVPIAVTTGVGPTGPQTVLHQSPPRAPSLEWDDCESDPDPEAVAYENPPQAGSSNTRTDAHKPASGFDFALQGVESFRGSASPPITGKGKAVNPKEYGKSQAKEEKVVKAPTAQPKRKNREFDGFVEMQRGFLERSAKRDSQAERRDSQTAHEHEIELLLKTKLLTDMTNEDFFERELEIRQRYGKVATAPRPRIPPNVPHLPVAPQIQTPPPPVPIPSVPEFKEDIIIITSSPITSPDARAYPVNANIKHEADDIEILPNLDPDNFSLPPPKLPNVLLGTFPSFK